LEASLETRRKEVEALKRQGVRATLALVPTERLSTVQVSHTRQPTKHEDRITLSLLKQLGDGINRTPTTYK
jgi:hypothetical protein